MKRAVMQQMHELFSDGVEFKKCGVILTALQPKSAYVYDLLSDPVQIEKNEKPQQGSGKSKEQIWR